MDTENNAKNTMPIELSRLRPRAEMYSEEDIKCFASEGVFEEEAKRINYFLQSLNHNVMGVYAPKGTGKTLAVMIGLLGKDYMYHSYFRRKEVPTFHPGSIVVIDDIHYMMDDFRKGSIGLRQLESLITDALEFATQGKGKVILISEDSFTDNYLPGETYQKALKSIRMHEMPIFNGPASVCKFLDINDENIMRVVVNAGHATPRGVTRFLQEVGHTWGDVVFEAKWLLQKEKGLLEEYKEQKLPMPKLLHGYHPPDLKYEEWTELFDAYKEAILKEPKVINMILSKCKKEVWKHTPQEQKKRILGEEYAKRVRHIESNRKCFETDVAKNWESSEAISFICVLFSEELYKDQGYLEKMRKILEESRDEKKEED